MSWRHTQNFLRSPGLTRALVARSSIGPDDLVVDLGAGKGAIAAALVERCRRVIAVEIDPRLVAGLERRFSGVTGVEVRRADARTMEPPTEPYKLFANIPFDATAAIMRRWFDGTPPPTDAYLILQREAAAKHLGLGRSTAVGMGRQPWFEMQRVRDLRRSDFTPPPSVDCVLARLRLRGEPLLDRGAAGDFRAFLRFGFAEGGRAVRHRFRGVFGRREFARLAHDAGFARDARCVELSVEHWLWLFRRFEGIGEASRRRAVLGR
ncbi:MAG: rRNA adenine N-6-methyltransferase family protein [Planctomycetota bacterium]